MQVGRYPGGIERGSTNSTTLLPSKNPITLLGSLQDDQPRIADVIVNATNGHNQHGDNNDDNDNEDDDDVVDDIKVIETDDNKHNDLSYLIF